MGRALVVALIGVVLAASLQAQTRQTAVEVSCTVQASPPQISFTWPADAGATGYTVYRRAPGATTWGVSVATLAGADTTWTDATVAIGTPYEYRFDKTGTPAGRGFCRAGIEVPAVHDRGTVILLVAENIATGLGPQLQTLRLDLVGDGWSVIQHTITPTDTVASVKALIVADYNADPSVNTVFILGHVPVPYSGNYAVDGHTDHAGAWPCDGYYGDIDGVWTDTSVNNTTPARDENDNIPGDGKFDQSTFPSDIELAVGRVDLSNMPAFAANEIALMQAYLDKNHLFRMKANVCQERAVIDDHFAYGSYPEAFASSGWRNFAPMFGAANVTADDYFTTQNTASGPGYLWSYGCGGGSYTSAGGIGSTTTFTTSTNRNIFTMLFGSYHGDWDSQNNFMRASLCSGWTLTCAWAGRPSWSFWQMALGETIGYCTRYSMNDNSPITSSSGARGRHMGLMGDPTLRMHVVAPASALNATTAAGGVDLDWTASTDAVLGYYVYRASSAGGPYTQLNVLPVAGTSYTDTTAPTGMNFYMLRAVLVQTSGSGSYYNLSQGVFDNIDVPLAPPTITNQPDDRSVEEGQNAQFSVTATGPGPLTYQWQRNNADIPGATSSSYTLANAALADDGDTFRCVVSNPGGNATSNAATLTVNLAIAPPIAPGPGGGGDVGGSCAATPPATIPPFLLIATALLARRRRLRK